MEAGVVELSMNNFRLNVRLYTYSESIKDIRFE